MCSRSGSESGEVHACFKTTSSEAQVVQLLRMKTVNILSNESCTLRRWCLNWHLLPGARLMTLSSSFQELSHLETVYVYRETYLHCLSHHAEALQYRNSDNTSLALSVMHITLSNKLIINYHTLFF